MTLGSKSDTAPSGLGPFLRRQAGRAGRRLSAWSGERPVAAPAIPPAATAAPSESPASSRWDAVVDPSVLGVPAAVVRPNAGFTKAYTPDRAGLRLTYRAGPYMDWQPRDFFVPGPANAGEPMFFTRVDALEDGERLTVLDDALYDFAMSCPLVRVRRESSGEEGFLSSDTLYAKTIADEADIWVGEDPAGLRRVVEFDSQFGLLYSTNRVDLFEQKQDEDYFAPFLKDDFALDAQPLHPLGAGATGHRSGVWALDKGRDPEARAKTTAGLTALLDRYLTVDVDTFVDGSAAWPYKFPFAMPWGHKLTPPWYSGYANAAVLGALSAGYGLKPDERYRRLVEGAVRWLQRPLEEGGALYRIDGFDFIAEYVYPSPAAPNYRVLDGEISSVPYLYNAALIFNEPRYLRFASRLAAGLSVSLRLIRRNADGMPHFGMDGQMMNPTYMWQMWMNLQLLAAIFKDRTFARYAAEWAQWIPASFREEGYPQ